MNIHAHISSCRLVLMPFQLILIGIPPFHSINPPTTHCGSELEALEMTEWRLARTKPSVCRFVCECTVSNEHRLKQKHSFTSDEWFQDKIENWSVLEGAQAQSSKWFTSISIVNYFLVSRRSVSSICKMVFEMKTWWKFVSNVQ